MLDAREFVLFVNILWSPRLKMASSWHDSLLSNTTTCAYVALSPDGKRMALVLEGSSFDVWVYDLERGTFTRASFGGRRMPGKSSSPGTIKTRVGIYMPPPSSEITNPARWWLPPSIKLKLPYLPTENGSPMCRTNRDSRKYSCKA